MAMSCGNAHFNKMRILPENVAPSCSGLENPLGEDAPGSARPLGLAVNPHSPPLGRFLFMFFHHVLKGLEKIA